MKKRKLAEKSWLNRVEFRIRAENKFERFRRIPILQTAIDLKMSEYYSDILGQLQFVSFCLVDQLQYD